MTESPVEDNLAAVQIIMAMRLYDVQMAILGKADPKMAEHLLKMHTKGEYFCPPPSLAFYPEEEDQVTEK